MNLAPADARAPFDYDSDPERFLLAVRLAERTASADLYARIAERLIGLAPVLDLGCGPGALAGALPLAATALVGLDRSPEMLRRNVACPTMPPWFDYLVARFFAREEAESAARRVEVPIEITKRGAVVYARR
ncbi:MAG: methyltransferase domain-containing protein [Actinobacteria bacterium]|nr:methyltransferase domain-containing protein [Actinomycetota bacterium]